MVRGVGSRLPLRRPGPFGSRLRQVPVVAHLSGVVPASQRRPAGLRVGLRGRQPARAGVGGVGSLRHRRGPGPRLPQRDLRQAAGELHVVGEPPRRRRLEPVRGRVPRARQHRADRSLAPADRGSAGAVRRDRLDGLLRAGDGHDRVDPQPLRTAPSDRSRPQVPGALRRHEPGDGTPRRVGRHRRHLLRQADHIGRHRGTGQGPIDGRHHPPARRSHCRRSR